MSDHRPKSIYYNTQRKRLSQEGHADIPRSCSAAGPSGGEIKGLGEGLWHCAHLLLGLPCQALSPFHSLWPGTDVPFGWGAILTSSFLYLGCWKVHKFRHPLHAGLTMGTSSFQLHPHLCLSQPQLARWLHQPGLPGRAQWHSSAVDLPVRVCAFWQPCFELLGRKMLRIVLIMGGKCFD